MELRHLSYFVAVAEELHFGRAARRLNISQPPLSQQIRQLEGELGVTLFTRTRRRVGLTAAGEVFLAEARRILAAVEEGKGRAVRADRGESGRLAVGFIGSANYSVLPRVIRSFRRAYPEVDISLAELNTAHQLEALRAGRIHVGFMRPPPGLDREGLEALAVFEEPLVAALPAAHPLSGRGPLDLALLAPEPFIMIPRHLGPGYFDYLISLCRQAGFSPRIALEASQFHTVIGMVAAGLGVAVVPASMRGSRFPGVTFRVIAGGAATILEMAWLRGNPSPVLANFIAAARRETAPQERTRG
ncbi:MAG TPA: LysR family transcriptional regulator [Syntrophales bacterium]|nr:LysR family transcriptional regulator [Syntrophales bacterium]HRS87868.1 LysR family transcriptional regulator [Syntrophales bacterium]HRV43451.1 LysR family transcriptional regulator [Syntrophales bacterium]